MKNAIEHFLFAAVVMCLACSFTGTATAVSTPISKSTNLAPAPVGGAYLVFAGKYGGSISKRELVGQSKLGVEGCAKGSRIFEFTLVVTKGGKTTSLEATSNLLTKEMLASLKSLAPGDSFEFKAVRAYQPPNDVVVNVHTQKFTVA